MKIVERSATWRLLNNVLRSQGWHVWAGIEAAHGNESDPPDMLATHPEKGALLVYLSRNVISRIDQEAVGLHVRRVYANGYDDFTCLMATGRPHVPPVQNGLFD